MTQKKLYLSILILLPISTLLFALPYSTANEVKNILQQKAHFNDELNSFKTKQNIAGRYNASSCAGTGGDAICVAVGFAINSNSSYPLITVINDVGNIFRTYYANYSTPGTLLSTSCIDKLCTAVGYQGSNSSQATPLLIQSIDNGMTWQTVSVSNMPATGLLNSISCTGIAQNGNAVCVAVGTTSNNAKGAVIVAQSVDSGKSWQVNTVNNLPNNLGDLTAVSCTTGICAAIGHDNMNNPIIIQTTDNGTTWSKQPFLFMMNINFNFFDINCIATSTLPICTTVGSNGTTNQFNPIIYQTVDGGMNWQRNTLVQFPVNQSGSLASVNCNTNGNQIFCSAAGYAGVNTTHHNKEKNSTTYSPLIMQSTDNGKSWQIAPITNTAPNWTQFLSTICLDGSMNFCFAAGVGDQYPILATSSNGLNSWVGQSLPNIPKGVLKTTSGLPSGSIYIATGYSTGSQDELLLIGSFDGGKTWIQL